ncbi:mucin-2-like [Paramacrobiotus metropolitanus]|uniref:mucin-2-like n=1 Tax=Paramacrobiotus metropolitanus TaxID=2943436 RepID=UPI002445EAE9|nr:mucin-2-like [Paramacrobiotus metropolitanus]
MTACRIAAVVVLGCAFLQGSTARSANLRTVNVDTHFSTWQRTTPIPYCLDASFLAAETTAFNTALANITATIGSCMTWTAVPCTSTTFKIRFLPLTDGTTPSYAYPGKNLALSNYTQSQVYEQIVGLQRSDSTLCSTDYRCIMKWMAISLSKRMEHERGDRSTYIAVLTNNLRVAAAYNVYSTTDAYWNLYPYDYCSITHNRDTDYAQPGTKAFTVLQAPYCIPRMATISKFDCYYITRNYQCATTVCDALPDCATQTCPSTTTTSATTPTTPTTPATPTTPTTPTTTPASTTTGSTTTSTSTTSTTTTPTTTTTTTTTTTPTTTTTTTTTTTAPVCIDFCLDTTNIDEASRLYNGNYYMFSGNCMVQIDTSNRLIGRSVQINTLLPGITGPVRSVWTDKYGTTFVITGTAQYQCLGTPVNCITLPIVDTPFARTDFLGTTFSLTSATPTSNYQNDGTSAVVPITLGVNCQYTGVCGVDPQTWSAMYTLAITPQFGIMYVIGKSPATPGPVQRAMMTLMQADIITPMNAGAGTSNNLATVGNDGVALSSVLGCPNAGAG